MTVKVRKALLSALRAGNFRCVAVRAAGISSPTLKRWLTRGRKANRGPYAELVVAVRKAEADAEARVVRRLMAQAETDLRAVTFFLERKFPSRWGRRTDVRFGGKPHHPLEVTSTSDTAQGLLEMFKRLAEGPDESEPAGPPLPDRRADVDSTGHRGPI